MLKQQSRVVATETVCVAKLKVATICSFPEKVCQPLLYQFGHSVMKCWGRLAENMLYFSPFPRLSLVQPLQGGGATSLYIYPFTTGLFLYLG